MEVPKETLCAPAQGFKPPFAVPPWQLSQPRLGRSCTNPRAVLQELRRRERLVHPPNPLAPRPAGLCSKHAAVGNVPSAPSFSVSQAQLLPIHPVISSWHEGWWRQILKAAVPTLHVQGWGTLISHLAGAASGWGCGLSPGPSGLIHNKALCARVTEPYTSPTSLPNLVRHPDQ